MKVISGGTIDGTNKTIVTTVLLAIAVMFFYFGDIITTWMILSSGGVELNPFLVRIGFTGYLVFKTVVVVVLCSIVVIADRREIPMVSGVVIGIMIMNGLLAVLINLGVFHG